LTDPNRILMWAAALVDELARAGVREVVLAPGYRSAPLVMAAAADARLRVFTHLDERSAAFFALGVGKRARRPAAVITTSGTAVANLLPAVVEASYSEAPLLLLTADRPHRLRGADANQAIDQAGIFGRHVRDFVEAAPPEAEEATLVHLRALAARAVASSLGRPAGPVHLNLPFAKPLAPTRVPGDVPDGFAAAHPLAARGRPEEAPLTRIAVRRSAPPAGRLAELAARAGAEAEGREIEETDRQKMAYEPADFGKPVELKAGECMFHHCLNFHSTPANETNRQRRAHVMIFMAEGVRTKLDQSPEHVLIPGFTVGDGEELVGEGFPLSNPESSNWKVTA